MEKPQHESSPANVPRFDSWKLARRMAKINGGKVQTVTVEMVGREDVKGWIDGLNDLRTQPLSSHGLRSKMWQSDSHESVEKKPIGQTLAERVAAIYGTVPVTITGWKFDPAVAEFLRRSKVARSVPPSDTLRCKNDAKHSNSC